MLVKLNFDRCQLLGFLLKNLNLYPLDFSDPRFYPDSKLNDEIVFNYFFFMTALDFGFSFQPLFYGYVKDGFYEGSKLLWRLGKVRFDDDSNFFTCSSMLTVTGRSVYDWLRVDEPYPRRINLPDVRAFLLRDAAYRLIKDYNGSFKRLVEVCNDLLYGSSKGFIERLSEFKAFRDPLGRKSFLLAKFLSRRGFFNFKDAENLEIPVDGKICRIALRLGLISLDDESMNRLIKGGQFTASEDYAVRCRVRESLKLVSAFSNVDPLVLHDFLDLLGESCCRSSSPVCVAECNLERCELLRFLVNCNGVCPLLPVCESKGSERAIKIRELNVPNTWYY
ncbi:MAG: hypothetical protein NDF53_00340 [archaeon GB-1867-097]|nr:hypothetical protein [Candidatus Culexmicrobium thermophilum]MCS7384182.1 hypothetical protein [Candidatus Culexmicrobium thermophilum]HDO20215.1 hypothetical protein [Candidatus Bathyarchaeota archaeon]